MNSSQIKNNNYRIGVVKRKLGFTASDKVEAGDLITKMNKMKVSKVNNNSTTLSKEKLSIMGLV